MSQIYQSSDLNFKITCLQAVVCYFKNVKFYLFSSFYIGECQRLKKSNSGDFFCVNRNEFTVNILSISMSIYSHNEVSENKV